MKLALTICNIVLIFIAYDVAGIGWLMRPCPYLCIYSALPGRMTNDT